MSARAHFNRENKAGQNAFDFFRELNPNSRKENPDDVVHHWNAAINGRMSISGLATVLRSASKYICLTNKRSEKTVLRLKLLKTLPIMMERIKQQLPDIDNLRTSNDLLSSAARLRIEPPLNFMHALDQIDAYILEHNTNADPSKTIALNLHLKTNLNHGPSLNYLNNWAAALESLERTDPEYTDALCASLYGCVALNIAQNDGFAAEIAEALFKKLNPNEVINGNDKRALRCLAQANFWFPGHNAGKEIIAPEDSRKSRFEKRRKAEYEAAGAKTLSPTIINIGTLHAIDYSFLSRGKIIMTEFDGPSHSLWRLNVQTNQYEPGGPNGSTRTQSALLGRGLSATDAWQKTKILRHTSRTQRERKKTSLSGQQAAQQIIRAATRNPRHTLITDGFRPGNKNTVGPVFEEPLVHPGLNPQP